MNGFLKTLISPDWDNDPKKSEIISAANLIHVGEFQFIQLAYKAWYKEDLPEGKVDKIFCEYIYRNIVPIWVSYYSRDITKLDKANILNGYNEKYHVYDHEFGSKIINDNQRKRLGRRYTLIIVFVFILIHFMAIKHAQEPADFLPPYIEKKIVFPELYEGNK